MIHSSSSILKVERKSNELESWYIPILTQKVANYTQKMIIHEIGKTPKQRQYFFTFLQVLRSVYFPSYQP